MAPWVSSFTNYLSANAAQSSFLIVTCLTLMVSFFRKPLFSDYRLIVSLYGLIALIASIKTVFVFGSNNYSIFYYSLKHLIAGVSLYDVYPAQYSDHYHYAPTFAALFAPVFALPYSVGLFLWHFLFAGLWVLAVYKMPMTHRQKVFFYWFGLQEMLTALTNSQTNPLIAAIPLFAFISFEKRQPLWAAFFIVVGFDIKIYSIVAGALFLLYPQKVRFLAYTLFWGGCWGYYRCCLHPRPGYTGSMKCGFGSCSLNRIMTNGPIHPSIN